MIPDFLAYILNYLATHVLFCTIVEINLPTYPKIGHHLWMSPRGN